MCNCSDPATTMSAPVGTVATDITGPTVPPDVPLAGALDLTPDDETTLATPLTPIPGPGIPIPPLKPCRLDFRDGCYAMTFRPAGGLRSFEGTLRVDRAAPDGGTDKIIVSGDLYAKPLAIGSIPVPMPVPTPVPAPTGDGAATPANAAPLSLAATVSSAAATTISLPTLRPRIPIFPRARYHSYLRITQISVPAIVPAAATCQVTLVAEQFDYTQPAAGQHKGSFPSAPSRTVTLRLTPVPAPFPYSLTGGPYFEGRLFEGGTDKGAVTLAWVSRFFRRATLEIDTLTGAVPPAPVPDGAGGTEFFDTIYAKIGWQLSVINDQKNVPVPVGVTPTDCWSSANLHALMASVRQPTTNLDAEWRVHLVVVPAKLGCSRGVMYDQIGVPREGCASFSDDGYPSGNSSNFGAAANKKQRDVPRAYLRSATHEVTHTFNQIHQEQETAADNSIMTTTPSVADVLGGPTTGAPGIFPDQINLGINTTVRHHLNHMPDPVIRPGGWPFASWFPTGAPQAADRLNFAPTELELTVRCESEQVALGQPVALEWTLANRSAVPILAPNNISTEALFTTITVTDGPGRERAVRPFAIICDEARLAALEPGQELSGSTRLFWGSEGFAFERPGRYRVSVAISWSVQGTLVGVESGVNLFVEYPTNDTDNRAAGLVLHPEVGKWVALDGGAYHLEEASRRLTDLLTQPTDDGGAEPRLLAGFADLLPDLGRVAEIHPQIAADYADRSPALRDTTARRAGAGRSRRH